MEPHTCQEPDLGQSLPTSVSQISSSVNWDDVHQADSSGEAAVGAHSGGLLSVTAFPNNQQDTQRRLCDQADRVLPLPGDQAIQR